MGTKHIHLNDNRTGELIKEEAFQSAVTTRCVCRQIGAERWLQ